MYKKFNRKYLKLKKMSNKTEIEKAVNEDKTKLHEEVSFLKAL